MPCTHTVTMHFSHGSRYFDSGNVQKRATKSDTSGHCLFLTFLGALGASRASYSESIVSCSCWAAVLTMYNPLTAGSYHDTQQSPPSHLQLLAGYLCGDVHACPSNEDPNQDIAQPQLGLACTPWCMEDHVDRYTDKTNAPCPIQLAGPREHGILHIFAMPPQEQSSSNCFSYKKTAQQHCQLIHISHPSMYAI